MNRVVKEMIQRIKSLADQSISAQKIQPLLEVFKSRRHGVVSDQLYSSYLGVDYLLKSQWWWSHAQISYGDSTYLCPKLED